jgi:aldehyde:ferredoxin oxidoreductase
MIGSVLAAFGEAALLPAWASCGILADRLVGDIVPGIRIRGGYHLSLLRVDLSTGAAERAPLGEEFALEHIGGPGFGTELLSEHLSPEAGALDPDNVLIFAPGPLTGLSLPGSARCHIMALSPQTGRIGGGSIGGRLGPAIRRAGYDAVMISGRAAELSYLAIDEDRIKIVRAPGLSGTSAQAAREAICDELGRTDVAVAAVGPAGEEQASAAIISSGGHHCGGGGMGAVMGSKNLKAIAVSGRKALPVADPAGLAVIAERLPSEARCLVDCEAGCRFKWLGPSGRHGGRLGRPSHDPALSPALARVADELGLDVKAAGGPHRRPATPEGMLLDMLGLCHQPWLGIEGGVGMAVECYRAVTGVRFAPEELLTKARAVQRTAQ